MENGHHFDGMKTRISMGIFMGELLVYQRDPDLKFNMKPWKNSSKKIVQKEIRLRHSRRFHVKLWEHMPCHILRRLDFTI